MSSTNAHAFIRAASADRAWHAAGTLDEAEALRAADPRLADASIHAAAVLGDAEAIGRHLARDPSLATAKGGPYEWDALTYLAFSRYLRLDAARSEAFVSAARALLDAGASASTGWHEPEAGRDPIFESAIYGAAGVAHHAGVTRLLLERGADPNDEETPYHTPETYDNSAMRELIASGRLTADSLAMMLLRKADLHDLEGMRTLLDAGADPNRPTRWDGKTALHQALQRDNHIDNVTLLLDRGADASIASGLGTGIALAARAGRADVLALLESRGVTLALEGADRIAVACARGDTATARALLDAEPNGQQRLLAHGGVLLARFAGVGNTDGVKSLLDLGVPVDARWAMGEGYWDAAPGTTALLFAAWRARHDTVRLLLERGADVNARDAKGRTPLVMAVKACVDSYWTEGRSAESVRMLLAAGATTDGVKYPSGYDEVDALLAGA